MSNRERIVLSFLIVISSIIAVYANTFTASWHFDDNTSIVLNSRIHLQEISVTNLKEVLFPSVPGIQTDRPVAYLSFALNWYFAQQNVFSYHLLNILIHMGSACLIFLIIIKCYETKGLQGASRGPIITIALFSSLLWALNPIQTQAVTYIVQRMASMAAFFYLAGILCYLTARLKQERKKYYFFIASLVFFVLALGTKQNTIIFPVTLVLLELIFLHKNKILMGMSTISLLLSILVTTAIAYWFLDLKYDLSGKAFSNRSFDMIDRILTEPRIVMTYLTQIFYPLPQRFSVIHDVSLSSSLINPISTVFSIVGIVAIVVFGIVNRFKSPVLAFAFLFFLLNHVVESTVMNLELVFEHRNYLPTAFLFWPISSLVIGAVRQRWENSRFLACSILVLFVLCVVSSGLWTYQRNRVWATEESLWSDAMKKSPALARPYLALAESSWRKGQDELALMLYKESLKRKDASQDTAKYLAFHNMAHIYFRLRELKKAEHYYKKALEIKPDSKQALYNLAYTLVLDGQYAEADELLDKVLTKTGASQNEDFMAMKGFVLLKKGFAEEAGRYFRSAYYAGNFNRKHLVSRACSLVKVNRYAEAERLLSALIEYYEKSPEIRLTIFFLVLENEIRFGNILRAEETAAILFDQYPIDVLGGKLIVGNDDLPLDVDLLKAFLRKSSQSFLIDFQQLHE